MEIKRNKKQRRRAKMIGDIFCGAIEIIGADRQCGISVSWRLGTLLIQ
jgi:hypothetical protein